MRGFSRFPIPYFEGKRDFDIDPPIEPPLSGANPERCKQLKEFLRRIHIAVGNLAPLGDLLAVNGVIQGETTWIKAADFLAFAINQGWNFPVEFPRKVKKPKLTNESTNPWLITDPRDPKPTQSWFIPARYFARELIKNDSTLLKKRDLLAVKVVDLLNKVGIKKRGGKAPFNPGTVKKVFSNVDLG